MTPLLAAAFDGHLNSMRLLLESGAYYDIEAKSSVRARAPRPLQRCVRLQHAV